jgi:carnitine 3-dehydrogenase
MEGARHPALTQERKQEIVGGVLAEAGGRSIDELSASCDSMLIALQQLRAAHP